MKRQLSFVRTTTVMAVPALASIVLSGCASLGTEPESNAVAQQLASLRATVTALQQKNTVTELEWQRLRVKVAELELQSASARTIPAPAVVTSPAASAPALTQTGPEDPIEPARSGKIVISDLEPEPVPAVPERPMPDPVVVRPPATAPATLPSTATPAAPGRSTGGAVLTAEAQALYDQGYTEYNQRQFVAAETTFQRFLQQYPQTSLADNAQYWIAESRYSRGDARGALASFRETVARYPEGNKAPDALLRAGRLFEELGDESAALDSYRELVRLFPDSADALLAEDRIKVLLGA